MYVLKTIAEKENFEFFGYRTGDKYSGPAKLSDRMSDDALGSFYYLLGDLGASEQFVKDYIPKLAILAETVLADRWAGQILQNLSFLNK